MGFEGSINATQVKNVNQATQQGNVKVLQEGSSVRVVVIADKGNGKYQGSVAGVRVNITSKNPMEVGSSFVATVSSKNGVIQLTPQNQTSNISAQFLIEQNQNQFIQFLSAFGLPQDSLSTAIMYQFKQLGMQFDSDAIRKIYTLAARFKNKEKIAATLISILKEKGIEAAESEIKKMISDLDFEDSEADFENGRENLRNSKVLSDNESRENENQLYNELLNFVNTLLNNESGNVGLLTVSNHIKKSSLSEENWIFIPFEMVNGKDEKIIFGKGNLKINLKQNNVLNKILMEYADENTYRFLMAFENNQLKNVKMNISNLTEVEISKKIKELSKKLNGIKVEWFLEKELENTAALAEPFYSVGGLV